MSIRFTDHAKVRYLERVLGIDLDDLFQREVLTESMDQRVTTAGDGVYLTEAGDCLLVVRQRRIVTVLLPQMNPSRILRPRVTCQTRSEE